MAAKPLDIHPEALEELKSATRWYMDRNPGAASKFVAEIENSLEQIVASPGRWPIGKLSTRKFVLRRFPFAVVYREKEYSIEVLAIAHGNRRPAYWKDRG
jgi:toxin ParE1/3/4